MKELAGARGFARRPQREGLHPIHEFANDEMY